MLNKSKTNAHYMKRMIGLEQDLIPLKRDTYSFGTTVMQVKIPKVQELIINCVHIFQRFKILFFTILK